jgi:hypothetical protein
MRVKSSYQHKRVRNIVIQLRSVRFNSLEEGKEEEEEEEEENENEVG